MDLTSIEYSQRIYTYSHVFQSKPINLRQGLEDQKAKSTCLSFIQFFVLVVIIFIGRVSFSGTNLRYENVIKRNSIFYKLKIIQKKEQMFARCKWFF